MVKIGWMQDTHVAANGYGAQSELVEDYNYLTNTVGVSDIYVGGDVCHAQDPSAVPHVQPTDFDEFFTYINQTDDPSALSRLVPGNHDVPLSTFLEADERCVLRDRIDYPDDNLTVLFVNTQATGFVTGSAGPTGQGGVGTEVCRVAYGDVQWLDQQIADADSQGNSVLIIPHAALTPIPSAPYTRVNGVAGQINDSSLYNIVVNHERVHGVIAGHATSGANIVVPVSHLFQTDGEGNETIDGVHYVYKNHYVTNVETTGSSTINTFAHIDMDGAGATVTTVEHNDKTSTGTTAVLDTTF